MTDYVEDMKKAAQNMTIKTHDERLDEAGKLLSAAAQKSGTGRPERDDVLEACRVLNINATTANQFADVYGQFIIAGLTGAGTSLAVVTPDKDEEAVCLDMEMIVAVTLDPTEAQAAPIILSLNDPETGERAHALCSLRQLDKVVDEIRDALKKAYMEFPPELILGAMKNGLIGKGISDEGKDEE